ncbi:hypothetical protein LEP1GSC064_3635 [Leptospira kirschneri serovar Grippotyphosa str. Moskva]|uniref:Uncharacterized protein n=1 Tax=Leptospira kirschneri str. H1 TaxID=1049966 RepID=A0A0E2AXD8_9LEPT|nr:hypothetical protein LEP1GSC044_1694 [Leptospira kirschneri serovar Grippotyphosa str. RM52]EKO13503.1 hypothetical protein LEP1GSC081_0155 [Leptospira kirschneri str. H1]EKO60470.1 hypothetical protein LEP1GSC082_2052 [Leptospira kirschneri str. H2]EKQ83957.1 hypothetical protein LEP1GSC064_3635 [Leptospira kirschneri serovar Grippotyphosa str. Moskva]EKR10496.1 hypothetical protein LEP1GSC122_3810 [Leptospira kirschneri serovar Valbuzzi str. 200702274]EMK05106.1 hypothetical protein LEP1G
MSPTALILIVLESPKSPNEKRNKTDKMNICLMSFHEFQSESDRKAEFLSKEF